MEDITIQNTKYADLQVMPEILQSVKAMGFVDMTEVQWKVIPLMMSGVDITAKAPTGTGKTCAFGIPIIEEIDSSKKFPQALVLAPTRELASQICTDLQELAQFLPEVQVAVVYGGQPMDRQKEELKKGPQIVVATPGRLLDHLAHRNINLDRVTVAVLDEADRMLDMGFYKDVRKILDGLRARKHLSMFSATISREVMDIGWLYQRDAEEINILPLKESEPKIDQYSIQCVGREKIDILVKLMQQYDVSRSIIFCNTKYSTGMVSEQLFARGHNSACLHGDMRQSERNKIMEQYKAGKLSILVATDVAARGIDVSDIQVVFNYDIPQENDAYLHRIGRTGRAKREGISFVLYSPDEAKRLENIIRYTRSHIIPMEKNDRGDFDRIV